VDAVVCDASFISLKEVLPKPMEFVRQNGILICLVKPQFEAKSSEVLPGGLVTDEKVHFNVCQDAKNWLNSQKHWKWVNTLESPILGLNSGNKEFLMLGTKSEF